LFKSDLLVLRLLIVCSSLANLRTLNILRVRSFFRVEFVLAVRVNTEAPWEMQLKARIDL
jgi:hypothetical protein